MRHCFGTGVLAIGGPATMVADSLREQLASLDPAKESYATEFVERLLRGACRASASDVHLQPVSGGLLVLWRLDGVLQPLGTFPCGLRSHIIVRLKVLAQLLTYRSDLPQEGRIPCALDQVEMRVSTFPTLHGERAVVRLFAAKGQFLEIDQLGLPDELPQRLRRLLTETSGAILITGPAGSGKTTTIYACLREMVRDPAGGRCLVSIEDPVEVAVDGVAQSQANPTAGLSMAVGLRSLLRQDPEVIVVGEIRDRETAEVCMQASLTGQLVLTTFHAETIASAIGRLSDMGIEPYVLRSGLLAILNQRLLRQLCSCAVTVQALDEKLGLPVAHARRPAGCADCGKTGYHGRRVLAELLEIKGTAIAESVLARDDVRTLERRAIEAGMIPLWQRAMSAVSEGWTSPAEVRRVFGFRYDREQARNAHLD
jgi:type II secretory ATPase GspE/PulE/Tfp pilus assembly ATPase PilB-like protein